MYPAGYYRTYGDHALVTTHPTFLDNDTIIFKNTYKGLPVTIIKMSAFKESQYIKSVILPKKLKKIEVWAFAYCPFLKSVSLPSGVCVLSNAFECCHSLESISIPDTFIHIDGGSFLCDDGLWQITVRLNKSDDWFGVVVRIFEPLIWWR